MSAPSRTISARFTMLLLALWLTMSAGLLLAAPPAPAERGGSVDILVTFQRQGIQLNTQPGPPNQRLRASGYEEASLHEHRLRQQLARSYRLSAIDEWPIESLEVHCVVYRVELEELQDTSVEALMQRMRGDPRIESVQPLQHFELLGSGFNDPYFELQHSARSLRIGQAHRWSKGHGVRIGMIDSGVDITHPDLPGARLSQHDFTAAAHAGNPAELHGTAIAGIIAAIPNNNIGIVGLAPEAELIVLRSCHQSGAMDSPASCDTLSLARAIDTAIRLQVQVLNMSLTGPDDALLTRLLDVAHRSGMLLIGAVPGETNPQHRFPSSLTQVLAVRATESAVEGSADFQKTNLYAPGREILSAVPGGGYDFVSGSSFAAAQVSAISALLLARQPDLSQQQLSALLRAAQTTDSEKGPCLDACRALAMLLHESPCTVDGSMAGSAQLHTQLAE